MLTLFQNIFSPPRHLILLIAASWTGLILSEKRAARYKVNTEALNNIIFYGLIGYIIGGRLVYALEYYSVFAQDPRSLISLNINLFDPVAAALTALMIAVAYGRAEKLSLWSALDSLAPFFATLGIGLALSHLAAGTAFGSSTDLPWAMDLWGAKRHPTQIYELLASLLVLGLIWFQKTDSPKGPGISFLTFAALTSASTLFIEAFRGDSFLIFGGYRLTQLIAWTILAFSLIMHERHRQNTNG